ncbi:hypothetical protein SAMN06265222_103257 [Neorhodopirellula lusitana]|uniref:Uncharacterized protein n=1 Tax=Neorhodopirellula lusitana TaxID=445327 RepID=A0ABY1PXX1_9BACT|nr:hypothetical protein SAMN06265222_103257 [Neorhodopirellula lusitana]
MRAISNEVPPNRKQRGTADINFGNVYDSNKTRQQVRRVRYLFYPVSTWLRPGVLYLVDGG